MNCNTFNIYELDCIYGVPKGFLKKFIRYRAHDKF